MASIICKELKFRIKGLLSNFWVASLSVWQCVRLWLRAFWLLLIFVSVNDRSGWSDRPRWQILAADGEAAFSLLQNTRYIVSRSRAWAHTGRSETKQTRSYYFSLSLPTCVTISNSKMTQLQTSYGGASNFKGELKQCAPFWNVPICTKWTARRRARDANLGLQSKNTRSEKTFNCDCRQKW